MEGATFGCDVCSEGKRGKWTAKPENKISGTLSKDNCRAFWASSKPIFVDLKSKKKTSQLKDDTVRMGVISVVGH